MIGICIEASHQRGMGHLFRAINLITYLREQGEDYILFCNDDTSAKKVLDENGVTYETVDLSDTDSNWEKDRIRKHGITIWLNDRLDTGFETAQHVVDAGIPLFTIDDMGEGASLADGNFASLVFEDVAKIPGKHVFAGPGYLILNQEIAQYKRERTGIRKILVTLGGSDTYGVTLQVVRSLKRILPACLRTEESQTAGNRNAKRENDRLIDVSVLLGPGAVIYEKVREELKLSDIESKEEENASLTDTGVRFELVVGVPSLMAYFADFDLAITGGGVTPMEAAASGLPTVVIANERHEIAIGRFLEAKGCSAFAGYYKELNEDVIRDLLKHPERIKEMSIQGTRSVTLEGCAHVYEEMKRFHDTGKETGR